MTAPTFKVKKPRARPYFVATKSGEVCHSTYSLKDAVAWKKAFGATVWKVTMTFTKVEVDVETFKL